ncbi:hypothetical protein C4573_00740 [Candidatus Woesearchaeota archaeon]|nr:MAG: hypothetical protein C4573_00740 [Candidatus Woesearchaeota archaeon]
MAYEMLGPLAFLAGMIVFLIIVFIALYIYCAFAWMTIAKKLNYDKPWLAWIPIANMFLIPILAKKNWAWGFIFLVPIVGAVFYFIWTWNVFEQRKYPGWLSLIILGYIIPWLGILFGIAHLVIIGLVAWKDR